MKSLNSLLKASLCGFVLTTLVSFGSFAVAQNNPLLEGVFLSASPIHWFPTTEV